MRRFRPTAEELEKLKGNWEKMFEGALLIYKLEIKKETCRAAFWETSLSN